MELTKKQMRKMKQQNVIDPRPLHERYEEIMKNKKKKIEKLAEQENKRRVDKDPESYGAATHKPQINEKSRRVAAQRIEKNKNMMASENESHYATEYADEVPEESLMMETNRSNEMAQTGCRQKKEPNKALIMPQKFKENFYNQVKTGMSAKTERQISRQIEKAKKTKEECPFAPELNQRSKRLASKGPDSTRGFEQRVELYKDKKKDKI